MCMMPLQLCFSHIKGKHNVAIIVMIIISSRSSCSGTVVVKRFNTLRFYSDDVEYHAPV